MGTMNRMRENTGIVLWILVISFGGLWVLQDSGVFDTLGANPLGEVIVVEGVPITNEQYQRQLEAQLEQIRQATGDQVEPERLELERERAFNLLVENELRRMEMDRLGITVSETEIQDLITGENPHAIILAYFPDEDGGVNRALLQSVIDDPEQEFTWIQLEEYIRLDRRTEKFNKLVESAVRITDSDIDAENERTSASVNVEFFHLGFADIPDSAVTLTDRELRRFYEDHREDYRQERLYSVELASVSKLPSREDTLAIVRDAERLTDDFQDADDDSLFLAYNGTDVPFTDRFWDASELPSGVATHLFESGENIESGLIVGPIVSDGAVHLVKVTDTRTAEDINVRARHILVTTQGKETEARELVSNIQQRLRAGENFGELARQYSEDPGSGRKGGDLGWFGPGTMVPSFQDAAFGARVGEVVGPVESSFGFHLIEVTHRSETEVQIADFAIAFEASVATLNRVQETLEDLSFYAEETGDFVGEAERRGLQWQSLQLQEGQIVIPDLGSSRAVAQFLETAETGDTSPVVELNEVSIMVHVVDIREEGYRSFEDVESSLRPRALREAKKEIQRERMATAFAAGGFDGLARELDMEPQSGRVTYDRPVASGLGRDPLFAGAVLALEEGENTGVMEGANAVFVASIIRKVPPDSLEEGLRGRIREQLARQRESMLRSGWIGALRESAEIEDLRTDLLQR